MTDDLSRPARRLLRRLDTGVALTKQDIARLTERHPRSASRFVRELRRNGVHVQERRVGRAKVFYLDSADQRRAFAVDLDEQAILALSVAAEAARPSLTGTPLDAPLARAAAAVRAAALALDDGEGPDSFDPEADAHAWHFGPPSVAPLDPAVFLALRHAIADAHRVRIDYVNARGVASSGRMLSPIALAHVRGAWQLAAYCHVRADVREFNLTRIRHVARLSTAAHLPDDFDPARFFHGRFGALQGTESVEVVLRVSPARAVYFHSRRYHASQREEPQPDGSLVVRFRVPGGDALDEVRAFVASWGPEVIALGPPQLGDRLAADARATADNYSSSA